MSRTYTDMLQEMSCTCLAPRDLTTSAIIRLLLTCVTAVYYMQMLISRDVFLYDRNPRAFPWWRSKCQVETSHFCLYSLTDLAWWRFLWRSTTFLFCSCVIVIQCTIKVKSHFSCLDSTQVEVANKPLLSRSTFRRVIVIVFLRPSFSFFAAGR